MDVSSSPMGVVGLRLQNEAIKTNGEAIVALVADAKEISDQAGSKGAAAISDPNVGKQVDVSA